MPVRIVKHPVSSSTTLSNRMQAAPYGSQNNNGRMRKRPSPIILQKGPVQGLEQTRDRQINRIQQAVRQAVGVIKSLPMNQGNMIEGLSLLNGDNTVGHGLPNAWKGALLTTPSAVVVYFVGSTSPANDAVQLNVHVSGDVKCSLWVW